jgi:hypothetical protein
MQNLEMKVRTHVAVAVVVAEVAVVAAKMLLIQMRQVKI